MRIKKLLIDPSLIAVLAEGFLSRISFGIIGFALPLYAYHLGMSMSAIGILASLNFFVEMMLKPVMGASADRFGLKNAFSVAVGMRSIVALALTFAGVPWHLFAIRTAHGVSESLREPAVNSIIAECGGKKTIASAFAWYNTARILAGSLGKAAGGILLTLTVSNYPIVFLSAFFLSIPAVFVVARYVKGTGVADGQAGAHDRPSVAPDPVHKPKTQTSLLPFIGFGVLISGTGSMLNILFPILATKYAGLSEAEAGIVYAASTVVLVFLGPLFGWLSDNVSRKLVLATRGVANTVSSVIYMVFPNFAGITSGMIIDDTGKAAFRSAWGALMAHISGFDRSRRGRTIGYMGLAENMGETGGPLLTGFLWNTWGITVVLAVRTVLAVITEVYAYFLIKHMESSEARHAMTTADTGSRTPPLAMVREPGDHPGISK